MGTLAKGRGRQGCRPAGGSNVRQYNWRPQSVATLFMARPLSLCSYVGMARLYIGYARSSGANFWRSLAILGEMTIWQ